MKSTPSFKRHQARKVAEKLQEVRSASNHPTSSPVGDSVALTHRRRICRHQNRRAFSSKGYVYNGAQPAGYNG